MVLITTTKNRSNYTKKSLSCTQVLDVMTSTFRCHYVDFRVHDIEIAMGEATRRQNSMSLHRHFVVM